jgi:hypothetical protein
MKAFLLILLLISSSDAVKGAEKSTVKPLSGVFASPRPSEAGELLELKDGRFKRQWFTDVGFSDTGTGWEHNPQTGSYIFDGYRLVLPGDAPLVVLVYYLVTIDGVDLLLDQDTARVFHVVDNIQSGNLSLRIPSPEADIAAEWSKVAREHPSLSKTIRIFEALRVSQAKP